MTSLFGCDRACSSAVHFTWRCGRKEGDCDDDEREGTKTSKLDLLCGMKIFSEEFSTFALNVKESKKKPEPKHQVAKIHDIWKIIKNCISRKSVNIFLTYISRKNGLNLPPFSCQLWLNFKTNFLERQKRQSVCLSWKLNTFT